MHYYQQYDTSDCGPACLLSIRRYYNCDVSLDELSYILKTNNEGTNAYNIINGARSFGFDGYGYHYTYEENSDGTITITKYDGTAAKNLEIPSTIDGKSVIRELTINMDKVKSQDDLKISKQELINKYSITNPDEEFSITCKAN